MDKGVGERQEHNERGAQRQVKSRHTYVYYLLRVNIYTLLLFEPRANTWDGQADNARSLHTHDIRRSSKHKFAFTSDHFTSVQALRTLPWHRSPDRDGAYVHMYDVWRRLREGKSLTVGRAGGRGVFGREKKN
jgi:hypothetical protein